ncbi:MAG TPA: DUF4150 domain-containing protein [Allosphingosinicella sp.]|jgi:uncharacterized Zn-binding protein involved in type VI secretion
MAQPIAIADGIAFAMPDVCNTPAPPGSPVPIPYPNIAQLSDATGTSVDGAKAVYAAGKAILLKGSVIAQSSGDEAGSAGGVSSGTTKGKTEFTGFSSSVKIHGKEVVRLGDSTKQNNGNAVGSVLSTPVTVLVGG